ncbi:MAG TPA: DUF1638 domain-containing protein [Anaerolineales bacterium]|nr:DUF1638 domain-containing protein [Anaerolineales bacterium]
MSRQIPLIFLSCEVLKGVISTPSPDRKNTHAKFLDSGLHATPKKLNTQVQEQIDGISESSIIVLGYGLCGNGLHGIKAGKHTLIIPKIPDCIALFMGGREIFLEEFSKDPGTYYLTKGWLQAGTHPLAEYERHIEKYGKEIADYVMDRQFQHYRRLMFVAHSQEDLEAYRPLAKQVAEFFKRWGMDYQEYLGTTDFITALEQVLVDPSQTDEEFIIVHPGETLTQDMFQ